MYVLSRASPPEQRELRSTEAEGKARHVEAREGTNGILLTWAGPCYGHVAAVGSHAAQLIVVEIVLAIARLADLHVRVVARVATSVAYRAVRKVRNNPAE